jgi:hypothetical protein
MILAIELKHALHTLAVADGVVYAIGGTAECTVNVAVVDLTAGKELG